MPPSAEPPITAAPSATAETASTLGDALRGAIDIDDIVADLGRLPAIADSNAGTRAVGTSGYEASVTFVADELRRVGFDVELQPVSI
ncbi:MAG: aminopeptidase, partial [Candidatus Limnocylindrales bacterium]